MVNGVSRSTLRLPLPLHLTFHTIGVAVGRSTASVRTYKAGELGVEVKVCAGP